VRNIVVHDMAMLRHEAMIAAWRAWRLDAVSLLPL